MWSTSRALWCGVCQATVCPAAFAAAAGTGEHPDFDRAADRGAVAAPVGEHLLAALLSEGIETLAAELQQLSALGVAQLLAAHKVVGALVVAGDAVEGEPLPTIRLTRSGRPRSGSRPPPGSGGLRPAREPGWLLPGKSVAQELHEHQGLVNVAHAHALGDGVAQALVGGGGGWEHGGILALWGASAGAGGVTGGAAPSREGQSRMDP